MPAHDRRVLIDQLRALLTHQRYNPVVIHNKQTSASARSQHSASGVVLPSPFS